VNQVFGVGGEVWGWGRERPNADVHAKTKILQRNPPKRTLGW